ncbi:MAG: hypothetical protein JNM68_04180 [Dinghuibacter sp.]|nr:hypothetical protein [Dinghuibacter sp.]
MNDSFFIYLEQLELMAFFAGYPVLYALVMAFFGKNKTSAGFPGKWVSLLPVAYALVGSLFLGLQIKNLYPDYSWQHIQNSTQQPLLKIWALLSLCFWWPLLQKRTWFSLLHSLVFFALLLNDIILKKNASSGYTEMVKNDMRIYTDSLLLNGGCYLAVMLIAFLWWRTKGRKAGS